MAIPFSSSESLIAINGESMGFYCSGDAGQMARSHRMQPLKMHFNVDYRTVG